MIGRLRSVFISGFELQCIDVDDGSGSDSFHTLLGAVPPSRIARSVDECGVQEG